MIMSFVSNSTNNKKFYNEIANEDIKQSDADKIVQTYENGADTEYSVAKVTGIDSWTCKKVLDIALKHNLLNQL